MTVCPLRSCKRLAEHNTSFNLTNGWFKAIYPLEIITKKNQMLARGEPIVFNNGACINVYTPIKIS